MGRLRKEGAGRGQSEDKFSLVERGTCLAFASLTNGLSALGLSILAYLALMQVAFSGALAFFLDGNKPSGSRFRLGARQGDNLPSLHLASVANVCMPWHRKQGVQRFEISQIL